MPEFVLMITKPRTVLEPVPSNSLLYADVAKVIVCLKISGLKF